MANKNVFVLDTSVLVYDYYALNSFANCEVILPITVIDELDKLKKQSNEVGKNARTFIRNLDALLDKQPASASCKLKNKATLAIDSSYDSSNSLDEYGDLRILSCASKLKKDFPNKNIIVVSRDINLRIRAKAMGLGAEKYEKTEFTPTELYTGFRTINDYAAGLELADKSSIKCDDELNKMFPNEFVLFTDNTGTGIATGRKVGNEIVLVEEQTMWGLKSRSMEQLFASDLLMDDSLPLVSIIGRAGGGKSLMAIAAGLELVLNQNRYSRFMIYRPIQAMGSDLGYLPGTIEEKLEPHFAAISDSMQLLFSGKSKKQDGWKDQLYQYINSGVIQQEALTYIRGRSISNAFILIDEAQNLKKDEIKTILTRAGEGSKIVLTGDIEQIDNSSLDPINNGLTYVVDKFKDQELAGHITLLKGERSELATLAAKIL
jgi:PhoH-like ATPase